MPLSKDHLIYTLNVEDIRQVLTDEGLGDLNDDELRLVEDKLGDLVPWYELILSAIYEAVPELSNEDNFVEDN